MTLWATTHATEYCRLACDLLVFIKCASPATKSLYAKELMTRLTSTGKCVGSDGSMEKSVNHSRKYLGKKDRKGIDRKFEFTLGEVPNRPTDQNFREELQTGSSTSTGSTSKTHEWLKTTYPSIRRYEMIHCEMQVWHHTPEPI